MVTGLLDLDRLGRDALWLRELRAVPPPLGIEFLEQVARWQAAVPLQVRRAHY